MKKTISLLAFIAFAGVCEAQTNNAYGDNQVQVDVVSGSPVYAIYSGDMNQDGYVDIVDYPQYEIDQLNLVQNAYVPTDLNGDGYVDIVDYPMYEANQLLLIQTIRP